MVGHWLTSAGNLAKTLIVRLVFIASLIILLPLAVLNRQSVSVSFNPLDLTRAAPESALTMPLFIALFAAFCVGLLFGWLLGYFGQNKRARALPVTPPVIKPSPMAQETGGSDNAPVFVAHRALSGASAEANDYESEASNDTRKSDIG